LCPGAVQGLNLVAVYGYLFICQSISCSCQSAKICRAAIVKPFSASSKISGNRWRNLTSPIARQSFHTQPTSL
ncbi:MAG: hypothetical protein ACREDU_07065, partial [Methylocella sp.]